MGAFTVSGYRCDDCLDEFKELLDNSLFDKLICRSIYQSYFTELVYVIDKYNHIIGAYSHFTKKWYGFRYNERDHDRDFEYLRDTNAAYECMTDTELIFTDKDTYISGIPVDEDDISWLSEVYYYDDHCSNCADRKIKPFTGWNVVAGDNADAP